MNPPRYQDITSGEIPKLQLENGVDISIISGKIGQTEGAVKDIAIDPQYLDITIPSGISYTHQLTNGYTAFAYIIEGKGVFCQDDKPYANETLILFGDGDTVTVTTENKSVRFLLISGKPLNEPIAWHGPIVMNTQDELSRAFEEFQNGTFLKQSQ